MSPPGAATHPATPSSVELIIVAYRSRPRVEEFLASVPASLPVAVVDNFDDGDGLRGVVAGHPNGRYLTGGNSGYARAANLAVRSSAAEFVVFVDPDERPGVADIETLVRDVSTDPRCSASTGMLLGSDGRPEGAAGGWEPTVRRALVHALGLHRPFPRHGIYCRPELGRPIEVDWVRGTCLAVRRQTYLDLGGFDEGFFVYNEDMAFGRRSRDRGMHQRLRTDVPISAAAESSGAPSLEMSRLNGSSMARYLRSYHGGPSAEVMVLVLALGHVLRALGRAVTGNGGRAREDWVRALGLFTGRATVAGRVVATRRGRLTAS